MSKYLDDSKWRSVLLKRGGFLFLNEIGTYLSALWNQKSKENMPQNTRLQRNGRQSPKSDEDMNDSCVKTRQTANIFSCFTHSHKRLRNVRCFECKSRIVVVGWRFRFR